MAQHFRTLSSDSEEYAVHSKQSIHFAGSQATLVALQQLELLKDPFRPSFSEISWSPGVEKQKLFNSELLASERV